MLCYKDTKYIHVKANATCVTAEFPSIFHELTTSRKSKNRFLVMEKQTQLTISINIFLRYLNNMLVMCLTFMDFL